VETSEYSLPVVDEVRFYLSALVLIYIGFSTTGFHSTLNIKENWGRARGCSVLAQVIVTAAPGQQQHGLGLEGKELVLTHT
jgi:hypothetical protein